MAATLVDFYTILFPIAVIAESFLHSLFDHLVESPWTHGVAGGRSIINCPQTGKLRYWWICMLYLGCSWRMISFSVSYWFFESFPDCRILLSDLCLATMKNISFPAQPFLIVSWGGPFWEIYLIAPSMFPFIWRWGANVSENCMSSQVWVVYKEQNLFTAIVWVILLICLGRYVKLFI